MSSAEQFRRHIKDLATDSFEGNESRAHRFDQFNKAIELATPSVFDVLRVMNEELLQGTGEIARDPMPDDSSGRDTMRWTLSWPLQRVAHHRITGAALEPVAVAVAFPSDYTHPHLGESKPADSESIWAWPFQVVAERDVDQLRFVFEAIASASLHERIFQADSGWRVLPQAGDESLKTT